MNALGCLTVDYSSTRYIECLNDSHKKTPPDTRPSGIPEVVTLLRELLLPLGLSPTETEEQHTNSTLIHNVLPSGAGDYSPGLRFPIRQLHELMKVALERADEGREDSPIWVNRVIRQ